jgi:hypothetical protein
VPRRASAPLERERQRAFGLLDGGAAEAGPWDGKRQRRCDDERRGDCE